MSTTISTQTHHITTTHADGTHYAVSFKWISGQEWSVMVTDTDRQTSDQGTFRIQDDGFFGIDGLESGPEAGFPSDHISMIQSEICQDLMNHGELAATNA